MASFRRSLHRTVATFVLISLHTGFLAHAKERSGINLQSSIEVPQEVLQNTLYYLVGDSEYIPETRGMPIYHVDNLDEPKYIEIKLKPHGYLLASLTHDDFPVVRFNGESTSKIPTAELGEAHKYVIYDESFDVTAIDNLGKVINSLSNAPREGSIFDRRLPSEKRDLTKKQLREEAKTRWTHDYVMECNRDHTIALCLDKLTDEFEQISFPDDIGTSESFKASGSVWDNELQRFVKLEKQAKRWVKGSSESPWEKNHLSLAVVKKVGKCGFAKLNVDCSNRIYNKPLWIGNSRITIVSDSLDDMTDERQLLQSTRQSTWSSWTTYSAINYSAVPNYNQHTCCNCISGCGAVAWAMLFAWADVQSAFKHTIYGTVAQVPPTTMDSNVEAYIVDIRNQIGTYCLFGNGATNPWNMDDVKGWFQNRGGGNLQASYSSIGIRTDALRDCAIDEIKVTQRPVVIGIGWLTHYPVATQYRVRTRKRATLFGTVTDTDHEAYLNKGWGGISNGWEPLSTWFCGTIDP